MFRFPVSFLFLSYSLSRYKSSKKGVMVHVGSLFGLFLTVPLWHGWSVWCFFFLVFFSCFHSLVFRMVVQFSVSGTIVQFSMYRRCKSGFSFASHHGFVISQV
jgi:hypothetical protein